MIPTYHCTRYLEQTLRSVLDQDPGPEHMEIVVVDDHSVDDDPGEVVRAVGAGRVRFVRQERNVGHVRTFNRCLELARGHQVHLLHGDDWVEPGFYAAADDAFEQHPDLAGWLCRYVAHDDGSGQRRLGKPVQERAGVIPGWARLLGQGQRLQAPSTVVRRSVYERLGGFDPRVAGMGEDWNMWLRVATAGPVWWEPRPLAVYRLRSGSLSDPSRLRSNTDDLRRVIRLNAEALAAVLPAEQVRECSAVARRELALALVRRGNRALGEGRGHLVPAMAREALRTDPAPAVLLKTGRLLAASVVKRRRRA